MSLTFPLADAGYRAALAGAALFDTSSAAKVELVGPDAAMFLSNLSTNGKVDLRRLPSPETSSEPVKNYVAPRTEDEQALAKIWQEVLMVPQVGTEDNFFDLGGDSLSATRAYAHTNQRLATQLTLRALFEHPTIASLARILRQTKNSPTPDAPILPRRTRRLTALT